MTTSTPRVDPGLVAPPRAFARLRRPRPAGGGRSRAAGAAFTLTEVIIAASLSAFLLAGVLSTFLLIGRTGLNSSAYAEMNARLRSAVERFDHDVRLAEDIRWQDERRLTLLIPDALGPDVTYAFEPATDPAAPGRFVRQADGGRSETLVRDVSPDFAFYYYKRPQVPGKDEPAENALSTKQIELRLRALRPGARVPAASQLAVSARCVLRNKNAGA